MDIEMYKQGAKVLTATPQCKECKYFIKGNAQHCLKYKEEKKPSYVMFPSKECPSFNHKNPVHIKICDKVENQVKGGIFGFCIGDALGVPLEFTSRAERKKDPVKEMRAYGTYHQPFGTWSDDSSMLLCLVENIAEGYSLEGLAGKFVLFGTQGYMTPHQQVFDIGNSTRMAIQRISNGIAPIECGGKDENDNGNGSLMRILPLAYYLKGKPFQEQIKVAEDVSSITHAHDRSKLACIIYIQIAISLLEGKEKKAAYVDSIEYVKQNMPEHYQRELQTYSRIFGSQILLLSEAEISSSGYVVDTLEAAVWSFLTTDSYEEAVFKAINLGGDTDTIAAIAGGLAGLYYGFSGIRETWLQCLVKNKEINELLDRFIEKVR